MPTAAEMIVEFLAQQGVDRAFCVPGESYIALLDALHQHNSLDLVTCRTEGGAGFMAVADAKLTGRPGVVLVSRGPGACNASIAVHTAEQDAVPLILLIGQVEKRDLRRNAFQEIDYANMFRGVAKWVGEATSADQVPELIARAYAMAMGGVPGPVVLSLPEDVLAEPCAAPLMPATLPRSAPPAPAEVAQLAAMLRAAERPILLVGHGLDTPAGLDGRAALARFAEAWQLPVAVSFRRQDLFDNTHALYAGDLGLRNPDAQRAAFAEADLVVALGTRLTDITTQGWSWPAAGQRLVHVCADARFLGWLFPAELALNVDARALVAAMAAEKPAAPAGRAGVECRVAGAACGGLPGEAAGAAGWRRLRRGGQAGGADGGGGCHRDAGCWDLRRAVLPEGGVEAGPAAAGADLRRHGVWDAGGGGRQPALPGAAGGGLRG